MTDNLKDKTMKLEDYPTVKCLVCGAETKPESITQGRRIIVNYQCSGTKKGKSRYDGKKGVIRDDGTKEPDTPDTFDPDTPCTNRFERWQPKE